MVDFVVVFCCHLDISVDFPLVGSEGGGDFLGPAKVRLSSVPSMLIGGGGMCAMLTNARSSPHEADPSLH